MKRGPVFLWHMSITFFIFGLWLTVREAGATTDAIAGSSSFTWGQVCVLFAVAAAWGDMRAQLRDVRKDVDRIMEREDKKSD